MVKKEYSVVIPINNEEGNILPLDKEIREVMDNISKHYEVIYIDDGSTDNSLKVLKSLKDITLITLNRNYGQATALDAGFKAASGDYVITMDGDLQNDPHDLPAMIAKMKEKALDVICGWRWKRKDNGGIRFLTKGFHYLRRFLIHDRIHDTGCTLRVYTQRAAKSLDLQGEMHRYIVALLSWKGFRVGEMKVNHRPRVHGKTKYGYSKAVRGFIDLLYIWFIQKYSQRPLHFFGYLSLWSLVIGVIIEIWMLYEKIFNGFDASSSGWFVLGFFFIGASCVLFSLGVVLDLLVRIKLDVSQTEKRYYVRELVQL